MLVLSISSNGYGFFGAAQIPYLIQILAENVKRYQQLRQMIDSARRSDSFLRNVHSGLENSINLLQSLPLKDSQVLSDLRSFSTALLKVERLYGKVSRSSEYGMQSTHDRTVAEGLKMVVELTEYTKKQERNVRRISDQSRRASPKGAARINVETNAQILHTLNQLLKVNGQMVKLQSEMLALNNKGGKDSVEGHQKVRQQFRQTMSEFSGDFKLQRF